MRRITRRRALQDVALAFGAAGLAPALAPAASVWAATQDIATGAPRVIPFAGQHQAGIATPQQAHACFASLDYTGREEADLAALLRDWSQAAGRMTAGFTAVATSDSQDSPPADSGEALGLLPARLTVTFGLGPALFTAIRSLRPRRPAQLQPLPPFSTDRLDPLISGGDLAIQACADDPYVAFHAVRMLLALATGRAQLRWMLRGFLPSDQVQSGTVRNLMGFKDGTANPTPADPFFDPTVWVQPADAPAWLRSGSYLVVRRIRMRLGHWDGSDFGEQEQTFGRLRGNGAPLTGGGEFTPPDFDARSGGLPVIPLDGHIRRAHSSFNGGARILRRGYAYSDGVADSARGDLASGGLDAGLLFLAYMRDPGQFIRIQSSLAELDHLNEYVVHVGSAIFAVPPGASQGGFVGETLLG
ncbi:MAG TPA: Dyp-type peroxidase [Candidatus Dormibacteraeota bacterium]|nr:Dyp-type peroxidase [Candidatus Dormibacteraeota bacterium]